MTVAEACRILSEHNAWRRGDGEMQSPKEIGEAIDTIVERIPYTGVNCKRNIVEDIKEAIDAVGESEYLFLVDQIINNDN